jgi:hypothetical protein
VLYVDGVAVSANVATIPTTARSGFVGQLVVGATEVAGDGISPAYGNNFNGAVDDISMYVFGNNETGAPGNLLDGEDWGTFNLFADNEWIAAEISNNINGGVLQPGDVNKDGFVNEADIAPFVAGWLSRNEIQGAAGPILVGDWNTWDNGDMDHNGVTDLDDAFILHFALQNAGAGGLDFGLLNGTTVPEPTSVSLLAIAAVSLAVGRLRTRRGRTE